MANLIQLTDAYQPEEATLPVEPLYTPKENAITIRPVADARPEPMPEINVGTEDSFWNQPFSEGTKVGNRLTGLGGEERYQLWPEKVFREGISAAGDVMETGAPLPGLRRTDFTDIPPPQMPTKDSTWLGQKLGIAPVAADPNDYIIEKAQAMSALAGSGGLAGTTDATLGATPFLRPALKYKDRLYKGKVGQEHQDVIPEALYPEFQRMAMSGEDISHFNFGFVNDKGHFLNREDALRYAIDTGLIDKHAGKYGALTSTLMADSSKPGTAIEAMAQSNPRKYMEIRKAVEESDPNYVYHITNSERANQIAEEGLKTHKANEFTDQNAWPDGATEKRNYFTPTPKNSWQFAPEEGKPALLRVKKDSHDFKKESTGDIYSKKAVAAEKIEYLNDEGKWVSLRADSSKEGASLQSLKMIKATPNDYHGNPITDYHGNPINVTEDGKLVLYHRTNEQSKNEVYKSGKFKSKENTNETFFSDHLDSEYGKGFGDHVVAVKVDPKYARLNDQFPSGENHYAVSNKYLSKANLLKSDNEAGASIQAIEKGLGIPPIKEPFYSAVEHQIDKISQAKMTGEQWLGTLANKPGVKPEEMQWTGLSDFLTENKGTVLTKQQVQEHLAANKIELKEVHRGELKFDKTSPYALKEVIKAAKEASDNPGDLELVLANDGDAYRALTKKFPELSGDEDWAAKVSKSVFGGDTMPAGTTKYHSYQLPGGENYRERLLTLPGKDVDPKVFAERFYNDWVKRGVVDAEWKDLPAAEQQKWIDASNDQYNVMRKGANNYQSAHWDEPNIIAHVRMNDRNFPNDKGWKVYNRFSEKTSEPFNTRAQAEEFINKSSDIGAHSLIPPKPIKSLHLEEIQSDWHQQGRDKGYGSKADLPRFHELNNQLKDARIKLSEVMSSIRKDNNLPSNEEAIANKLSHEERANLVGLRQEAYEKDGRYADALKETKRLEEAAHEANPVGKIPDAPFKKTWHELALKRMIREAAEKGYDRLSWTPGEAQAARYDLSKQIDRIHFVKTDKGYLIAPESKGREVPINDGQVIPRDKIADYVGKEVAEKIIAKAENVPARPEKLPDGYGLIKDGDKWGVVPDEQAHARSMVGLHSTKEEAIRQAINHIHAEKVQKNNVLENVDLKIGGEGMKGFYDQIIPKALEKIGKEHGVKVKQGQASGQRARVLDDNGKVVNSFDDKATAERWLDRTFTPETAAKYKVEEKSQPIHYIDIPQSLKDTAMHKGFPLFSSTHMFTPVAGDPFKDKKK